MIFLLLALVLGYCSWFYLVKTRSTRPDPPGPRPFPLVGNLFSIASAHRITFLAFHELVRQYGPLVRIWLGPKEAMIIGGDQELKEMMHHPNFDSRSIELSPITLIYFGSMESKGVLFNSGDSWRDMRRFSLRTLRDCGFGKQTAETIILDECAHLLDHIRDNGPIMEHLQGVFDMTALNIVWSISAGTRYNHNDEKMRELMTIMEAFNRLGEDILAGPSSAFNFLRHFPPFAGKFKASSEAMLKIRTFLSEVVREHRDSLNENSPRDFIDTFLIEQTKDPEASSIFQDDHLIAVLMDIFIAGSETTSKTLCWASVFMMLHPEVQSRVQDELDREVGDFSMVHLSHRPRLPYTEATLCEIWRLGPVGPIAAVRTPIQDTTIGGCTIKKGTLCFPLLYSLTMDPEVWPEPERFDPSRHLTADGKFNAKETFLTFGTGRRKCLGESVAKVENFLLFANLIKTFRFRPVQGDRLPELDPVEGMTIAPKPFVANVTPRT